MDHLIWKEASTGPVFKKVTEVFQAVDRAADLLVEAESIIARIASEGVPAIDPTGVSRAHLGDLNQYVARHLNPAPASLKLKLQDLYEALKKLNQEVNALG